MIQSNSLQSRPLVAVQVPERCVGENDDYAGVTERKWVKYEFATIEYDFSIHPEAARQIRALFNRLASEDRAIMKERAANG